MSVKTRESMTVDISLRAHQYLDTKDKCPCRVIAHVPTA